MLPTTTGTSTQVKLKSDRGDRGGIEHRGKTGR